MGIREIIGAATLGVSLLGCATGYHSTGATGGFQETQLGPAIYQVRFNGNAYTSNDRASEFLMRRCAEVALEHGKRYFVLKSSDSVSETSFGYRFPSREAVIQVLDEARDDSLDAVIIIDETADRAHGQMSAAAARTYRELKAGR
jgi:hypothetical protein